MAHADYDCCAVCDQKQSYSSDATTKEELCASCAVELARRGVFVKSGTELVAWMKAEPERAREILPALYFTSCYYANKVDETAEAIGVDVRRR